MTNWEPVIGLEVHVQLSTASKAFSGSSTAFGGIPNAHVDPTVLALPGALPVFNHAALLAAVRLGLGLGCTIDRASEFSRKHYFYPDSPKGYQISQYDKPICTGGQVPFLFEEKQESVELERIHLEEDAGKSTHEGAHSLVDLNRAGIPLCEIVTKPVLRSAGQAAAYMKGLRQIVRFLRVSDGDMEKGQLRCDANVSIRPVGQTELGTRTELKNINSFRFVETAIEVEIARQITALESGETITQETRLWDPDKNQSFTLRSKEDAEDYRYFPDPDLPALTLSESLVAEIKDTLPLMPAQARETLASRGIEGDVAETILAEVDSVDFVLETTSKDSPSAASQSANWLVAELLPRVSRDGISVFDGPVSAEMFSEFIGLIDNGVISGKQGKAVFEEMYTTGSSPTGIVESKGLKQISDVGVLAPLITEIIAKNPKQASDYRGGKEKLLGFFVGQVMKRTKGNANPETVNELLLKALRKE